MRLSDHLRAGRVIVGLQAEDRPGALAALARALVEGGVDQPAAALEEQLARREQDRSTVLGRGIAVPHAVVPELLDPVLLVAVTDRPIPFGESGEEPVRVFFTLLTPPDREGDHIRLLARICRVARHQKVLDALMDASDATRAMEILVSADDAEG